jgi:hypothetical protein
MCRLFDRLDNSLNRVERIVRTLGTEDEPILPKRMRITLVDQLIHDVLENKPTTILVQELLRNGCVGFMMLPDLILLTALRDNILERGLSESEHICPTITKEVVEVLEKKEKQLLED